MARLIKANNFVTNDVDVSTLERMQKMVGGYIEFVYRHAEGKILICNEEGLLLDLPVNEQIAKKYGIHLRGDVIEATSSELN